PATATPQSQTEKKVGMTKGRALPTPELLQPTLDPALPSYVASAPGALKGHYKAAVSDVLPGQVKLWVAAFERRYPDVKIEIVPPYAGSLGAVELAKQKLDFVFVSRELRPTDIKAFHDHFGYDPLSVPISGGSYRQYGFLDAVGVIVNRDNPLDEITTGQLDAILSTTRVHGGPAITTWGQLGLKGAWADKPIHVYAIQPWNGFEEFVRQRILSEPGKRGEWRTDINFAKVVFPIAGEVARDPDAIGYTGMAYVDAPVKTLAIGRTSAGPFYPPSYEAVASAKYPLSRLIYFNVNKAPGKPLPPAIEEFLKFVLSRQGQGLVLKEGVFIPLRGFQAEASRAMLKP
ncbi:MAG: substrate-binding domain-containing protein, partial [Alphaproteobacteria bacterium]|nr:substrate-binding domain-containing protein [Alphaproteobacteria bacterium]